MSESSHSEPTAIAIDPVTGPIDARVRPPGSKSITNRALVVAALAEGTSRLEGVLDSLDTRVMIEALRRLGIVVTHDLTAGAADVEGCGGRLPAKSAELWLENSGTSIRFLTAVASLGSGTFRLDGNARMRERPIQDLCGSLNELGGRVVCERDTGCPPVRVTAAGLRGGTANVSAGVSSQFLSALLMASPCATSSVEIQLDGPLVSEPYVDMTIRVMEAFGVLVEKQDGRYRIAPQRYRATRYSIEPDASAASYFFAAAAITGGRVTVEGLSRGSLQGDVRFVDLLEQMGCRVSSDDLSITVQGGSLRGIDVDMNGISDTAQTLAAVAVFAKGPTRIRNVAHMRKKETDRIHAVVVELRRLGIDADEHADGLTVRPGAVRPATIETYDDHRMAMSFALVGLKAAGIKIAHPECTAKTYPRFFEDLEAARAGGKH